jgi:hypothetical protein
MHVSIAEHCGDVHYRLKDIFMHACVFVVDAVPMFNQAGAWRLSSSFCIAVHNTPDIFVMHACVFIDAVTMFNQAGAWRLSGKFHIPVHNTPEIYVMHACVLVCVCVCRRSDDIQSGSGLAIVRQISHSSPQYTEYLCHARVCVCVCVC